MTVVACVISSIWTAAYMCLSSVLGLVKQRRQVAGSVLLSQAFIELAKILISHPASLQMNDVSCSAFALLNGAHLLSRGGRTHAGDEWFVVVKTRGRYTARLAAIFDCFIVFRVSAVCFPIFVSGVLSIIARVASLNLRCTLNEREKCLRLKFVHCDRFLQYNRNNPHCMLAGAVHSVVFTRVWLTVQSDGILKPHRILTRPCCYNKSKKQTQHYTQWQTMQSSL